MKKFKVMISDGSNHEIEAAGFEDCAAAILCEPSKYPLPNHAVVGIEGPRGSSRFYLKREDCRNLFPISVRAAAFELSMAECK